LSIKGRHRDGTDDDVHTPQGVLDGCVVGVIDLDHLSVTLNGILGALSARSQGSTQHIKNNLIIRWIPYLARKDDDFLDDPSSFVREELLNNIAANGTCPGDREFRVSRHDLTVSAVRVIFSPHMFALVYLSSF
jgi:hypothetical protein